MTTRSDFGSHAGSLSSKSLNVNMCHLILYIATIPYRVRDIFHHLASCCLVAGKGIKGNTVIGGTTDNNYAARPIDLKTGQPDDITGTVIRPPDVHRTLLHAQGFHDFEHISNQDPVLIDAMLG